MNHSEATRQPSSAIPLRFANGSRRHAVVKGFMAAWLCDCGYPHPLMGIADAADSESTGLMTDCPACSKRFRVVAERRRSRPRVVEQVEPAAKPDPTGCSAHA